jgi:LysR family nitrogen assimilation transcriptional regulator
VLGLTNGFANVVGRDLVLQARRDLPAVELSVVEERSVVLVEALERHEIDIALAYEVHERPGLLRVPLLEEETLFVTAPVAPSRVRRSGKHARAGTRRDERPIDFAELATYPLVMPGPRDGVRQQVLATAKRLAIPLQVTLDVSSVSMMKNMVARGDAAAIMPYGNVIDDVRQGTIVGRRIADPPLKRTMYLVRPMSRAAFEDESGVLDLIERISRQYVDTLGVLAKPLAALRDGALRGAAATSAG